jgi:hypothetical protein
MAFPSTVILVLVVMAFPSTVIFVLAVREVLNVSCSTSAEESQDLLSHIKDMYLWQRHQFSNHCRISNCLVLPEESVSSTPTGAAVFCLPLLVKRCNYIFQNHHHSTKVHNLHRDIQLPLVTFALDHIAVIPYLSLKKAK